MSAHATPDKASQASHPVPVVHELASGLASVVTDQAIDEDCIPCREKRLARAADVAAANAVLLRGPYDPIVNEIVELTGATKAVVKSALLFVSGGALEEPNEEIRYDAFYVAKLFTQVGSILKLGVRSRAALEEHRVEYVASSDASDAPGSYGRHCISAFDINFDQNGDGHYRETYPKPGHASVSVTLERFDDLLDLGRLVLETADEEEAKLIEDFQAERRDHGPLDEFKAKVAESEPLLRLLGQEARFKTGADELEGRAMRSAMVISSGDALTTSPCAEYLKKPGLGPRVSEMRANTVITPEQLTHVVLPDWMKGFPLLSEWPARLEQKFVDEIIAKVDYFDAAARFGGKVVLSIPNYQRAIDELKNSGVCKMLTHITNF